MAAVVSSPSSTGNTGSGSSGLALTGVGDDTPVLILAGVALVAIGILGRRRLLGLARRAKRSHVAIVDRQVRLLRLLKRRGGIENPAGFASLVRPGVVIVLFVSVLLGVKSEGLSSALV